MLEDTSMAVMSVPEESHHLRVRKAPMQVVQNGFPMDRLATDIMGELPLTESGNRSILVVSNYFTRWTESFPMPNMEARTVAKILVEQVITRFGVPYTMHSDQGRQYESELFKEMCSLLQIEKTHYTISSPIRWYGGKVQQDTGSYA